jgi:cellobiose-specific phosphotransferase system component IIB
MATKKSDGTFIAPQVKAQLKKLARAEASRVTGVPVSQIKQGKKPIAGKKGGSPKKGNKANG